MEDISCSANILYAFITSAAVPNWVNQTKMVKKKQKTEAVSRLEDFFLL
jgi:hypothetical protein